MAKNGPGSSRGKKAPASKSAASTSSPASDRNLARLKEIVHILESSTLGMLRYEDSDIAVEVRRSAGSTSEPIFASEHGMSSMAPFSSNISVRPEPTTLTARPKVVEAVPENEADVFVVRSPFVGTFYSSPSPNADKFTDVGKAVRRGQTICIIEAMKLMNEIESEVDGVVIDTHVDNGKPVQYGDTLFRIRTKS